MALGHSGKAFHHVNVGMARSYDADGRLKLSIGPVIVREKVNRASASPAFHSIQAVRTGDLCAEKNDSPPVSA